LCDRLAARPARVRPHGGSVTRPVRLGGLDLTRRRSAFNHRAPENRQRSVRDLRRPRAPANSSAGGRIAVWKCPPASSDSRERDSRGLARSRTGGRLGRVRCLAVGPDTRRPRERTSLLPSRPKMPTLS